MSLRRSVEPERLRPITLAQWADLPEDEPGEFVDGFLVEEEDVGALHDVIVGWLMVLLGSWGNTRGATVAVSDTTRFALTAGRGRKPDLWAYLGGRKPPAEGLVAVPPDLVVEVVSPTPRDERRDRVEKVDEYAAFGVRWYWIVDPQLRSFQVLELGDDNRYSHAVTATSGLVDRIPGCPGLSIDLDALWAKADSLVST
ncbi:MAG: Uma2 family endonuclease [Deltaproteobacteria bacterium]|nr:Uma2 family endonuclease [Deltaproteobacteria bacterium]